MFKYYSETLIGMRVEEILPFLNQDMLIYFVSKNGKLQKAFYVKQIPIEYQEQTIYKAFIDNRKFYVMFDRNEWVFSF